MWQLAEALDKLSTLPLVAISLGRVRGIEPSVTEMDTEVATSIANMLPTARYIGSFVNSDEPGTKDWRWFTVTSRSLNGLRLSEVPQEEVEGITSLLESLDRDAE